MADEKSELSVDISRKNFFCLVKFIDIGYSLL